LTSEPQQKQEDIMQRLRILAPAVAAIFLAFAALPVAAQDILGLSLRPTDAMPAGTARGTVDIVSDGTSNFKVTVDLSAAAETMKLEDFEGATGFTVWAVDMNGVRHNLGTLDEGLVLKEATAGFPIAMIQVTAEPDPAAAAPTGEVLFTATLRTVTVTDATATPATAATAAGGAAGATAAPAATTAPAAAAPAAAKLPTTGAQLPDLAVWAAVAAALLLLGWRLRATRL
jgi:hypothetical protein